MKVGIQTNAWSDELHKQDLPGILGDIEETGYIGFEVGSHRVDLGEPSLLCDLAARRGLAIVGLHCGGDLWNPATLPDVEARVARVAAFSAAVGAPFLPVSSGRKPDKSPADYAAEALALNRLGKLCADHGLRLAYHNHDWEVWTDYAGLRSLCELTEPGLVSLALDVGWVAKAGGSPTEAAGLFLDRTAYFHLKDTLDDWFTELGRGTANLEELGSFLRREWDGWLVVERDKAVDGPVESAAVSREYLRARWGV